MSSSCSSCQFNAPRFCISHTCADCGQYAATPHTVCPTSAVDTALDILVEDVDDLLSDAVQVLLDLGQAELRVDPRNPRVVGLLPVGVENEALAIFYLDTRAFEFDADFESKVFAG